MYETFKKDQKLSELSTFAIGGPAKYYLQVQTIEEMQRVMRFCKEEKLSFFILGKGSNCLFDSKGLNRLVIHNKIDFCQEENPGEFYVGAGYSFSLLGMQTAKKGWTGLEFASGIPATVGGAVYMNAGAQGQSTFDTLQSVSYVHPNGTLEEFAKEMLISDYRTSSFQKMAGAIVAARFLLKPSEDARKNQLALLSKRIQSQPYQDKTAGCVFKNPLPKSAGALIDELGLKGYQIGGAKVSEMHANFLVNTKEATSDDMRALISHIKEKIKNAYGIELDQEVYWITDE